MSRYENSPDPLQFVLPALPRLAGLRSGTHGGEMRRVGPTPTTPSRQATPLFHRLVRPPWRSHSQRRSTTMSFRAQPRNLRRPPTVTALITNTPEHLQRRTGDTRYPRWRAEVGTLDTHNSQPAGNTPISSPRSPSPAFPQSASIYDNVIPSAAEESETAAHGYSAIHKHSRTPSTSYRGHPVPTVESGGGYARHAQLPIGRQRPNFITSFALPCVPTISVDLRQCHSERSRGI